MLLLHYYGRSRELSEMRYRFSFEQSLPVSTTLPPRLMPSVIVFGAARRRRAKRCFDAPGADKE